MASVYHVAANLGYRTMPLKYDTGAKCSVISAGMFDDTLTDEGLTQIKNYCETNSNHKERFISASGHTFDGYLITAHDVKIGKTHMQEFRYYLVVENQRDIALLGFDFIDNCEGSFEPHSDILRGAGCGISRPATVRESGREQAFFSDLKRTMDLKRNFLLKRTGSCGIMNCESLCSHKIVNKDAWFSRKYDYTRERN